MDAKNLSNKLELWVASDGWPFFVQPDGSLTDTIDPSKSDLGWDSLTQFLEWDDGARLGNDDDYQKYLGLSNVHAAINVQIEGLE